MDANKDDKSIVEKTVDAVKEFAATISEAAHKAVEPEPVKPGDELVMMPVAATGFMGETVMPPFVVIRKQKKMSSSKKSGQEVSQKGEGCKKNRKESKTASGPKGDREENK